MPKYTYKCTNCRNVIARYHSFSERLVDCPVCSTENCLKRLPSSFLTDKQDDKPIVVGNIVKEFINETKEALEEQKENLRSDWNNE